MHEEHITLLVEQTRRQRELDILKEILADYAIIIGKNSIISKLQTCITDVHIHNLANSLEFSLRGDSVEIPHMYFDKTFREEKVKEAEQRILLIKSLKTELRELAQSHATLENTVRIAENSRSKLRRDKSILSNIEFCETYNISTTFNFLSAISKMDRKLLSDGNELARVSNTYKVKERQLNELGEYV